MSAPLHELRTTPDRAAILATVIRLAEEVIDGDGLDPGHLEVTRETSVRDIAIESVELIALGEMLLEEYGWRVDLGAWLGDLDGHQITALTVGQLVDFVADSLVGIVEPGDGRS